MYRKSEISQSFNSTNSATFSTKASSFFGTPDEFYASTGKSPMPKVTIHNHGTGCSTTFANNGDASTNLNPEDGLVKPADIKDGGNSQDSSSTAKFYKSLFTTKPTPHNYCVILLLLILIASGLAILLWQLGFVSFHPRDGAISNFVSDQPNFALSSSTDSLVVSDTTTTTHATTTALAIATTTAKKRFGPVPRPQVILTSLKDIASISNKTKEVIIKSTIDGGTTQAILDKLIQPFGNMTVRVEPFDDDMDLDHLRFVLDWLSLSTYMLSIDANVSKDKCNTTSYMIDSKEGIMFPTLRVLEIYNLNSCFLSQFLNDFRIPSIKHVYVRSAVDYDDHDYHSQVTKIINKSNLHYDFVLEDDTA